MLKPVLTMKVGLVTMLYPDMTIIQSQISFKLQITKKIRSRSIAVLLFRWSQAERPVVQAMC